jgi:Leucine-rich repeat (LRR) protein/protein-tyrosine phosphatase
MQLWKAEIDAKRLNVCYGLASKSKIKRSTDDDFDNLLLKIDFDRYDTNRDSVIDTYEFKEHSMKDGESESISVDLEQEDAYWKKYSKNLRQISCEYDGVTQTLQSTPSTRNLHAACKFISGQPHLNNLKRHMRYLADVQNVRLYINFNVEKNILDRTRHDEKDVEREVWKEIEEYKTSTCNLYLNKKDNIFKRFGCHTLRNFKYLNLPIQDFRPPSVYVLTTFLNSLQIVDDRVRKSGQNESVYWHCTAGYGRSGFMLACYLWDKENYSKLTFRQIMQTVKEVYSINAYEEILEDYQLLKKRLQAFKDTQIARNKSLPKELETFSCEEIAKRSIISIEFENALSFQAFIELNNRKNARADIISITASSCNIDKAVMHDLARMIQIHALPELQVLNLRENRICDDAMTALSGALGSRATPQLKELTLDSNQIGDAGMQSFAVAIGNGAMAKLTKLSLSVNKIGDAGMQALAAACGSGAMANLTKLHLSQNKIGAGMVSLSIAMGSGAIPKLEELSIFSNKIDNVGMQAFATACSSGAMVKLTQLDLAGNEIGDVGIQAFATACGSGALPHLQKLSFRSNKIGDVGMQALVAACGSGALEKLTEFDISYTQISNNGLQALATAFSNGAMAKLTKLSIATIKMSAFASVIGKLKKLYLRDNQIDDNNDGILAAVISNGSLPALEEIYVDSNLADYPQLVAACETRDIELS